MLLPRFFFSTKLHTAIMDMSSPLIAIPMFTALIVMVVASPVVFKITSLNLGDMIGIKFASSDGLPTRAGLIAHAGVAFLLMYAYLKAYSPESSSF